MENQAKQEAFEEWCIIDLFGHQRIAGKVREQTIGGCAFLRVDVPAVDGQPAMTRFFGQGAIYSMSPVTQEIALAAASRMRPEPVHRFELPALPKKVDSDHPTGRDIACEQCGLVHDEGICCPNGCDQDDDEPNDDDDRPEERSDDL